MNLSVRSVRAQHGVNLSCVTFLTYPHWKVCDIMKIASDYIFWRRCAINQWQSGNMGSLTRSIIPLWSWLNLNTQSDCWPTYTALIAQNFICLEDPSTTSNKVPVRKLISSPKFSCTTSSLPALPVSPRRWLPINRNCRLSCLIEHYFV